MTEQIISKKKNSALGRVIVGVVVSAAALAVVLYFVDLEEVTEALKLANYSLLPLAILGFLATLIFRGLSWRTILRDQVSFSKAFYTENEGYLLNNVLPFRLGELGRAYLLSQTTSLSFWEVLPTIMVERVFDVGFMAGSLLVTVPFVIGADWAMNSALVAGSLVVVGFVVLFLLARSRDWTLKVFERLTSRWPRLYEFGKDKLASFLDGLAVVQNPVRFARVLLFMAATWAFNFLYYFTLLKAFFPEAQFMWAVFSVGVISLGVAAPSTPAYIGVYHAATVGSLALFGLNESTAFSYSLVGWGMYFILTGILGAIGLARDGQSLGKVFRGLRNRDDKKENI